MNAPSEDIKDMLVADGDLNLTFAVNLFVGKEPTSPNNCVTVFDTPGSPPLLGLNSDLEYYYPSIQIRVRHIDYIVGYEWAYNIMKSLHARSQEAWNDTSYSIIRSMGDPAHLDWDENGRSRFVINFDLQRTN